MDNLSNIIINNFFLVIFLYIVYKGLKSVYHDFKNKQYRRKKGNNFICFYENLIDRHSLITLVEGIFDANRYTAMFQEIIEKHPKNNFFFYLGYINVLF